MTPQKSQRVTIEVTIDQTNNILDALAHQPYGKVYDLIGLIMKQVNEQIARSQSQDVEPSELEKS